MDDNLLDPIERKLESMPQSGAPATLRAAVLSEMDRELRAARWDRRLARTAFVLLVVGVGLNAAIGLGVPSTSKHQVAREPQRDSLVQVAMSVAEATDAQTGSRFARQLAALTGRSLTGDEAAAIEAAVQGRVGTNGT
jgi:hypothetical protein